MLDFYVLRVNNDVNCLQQATRILNEKKAFRIPIPFVEPHVSSEVSNNPTEKNHTSYYVPQFYSHQIYLSQPSSRAFDH